MEYCYLYVLQYVESLNDQKACLKYYNIGVEMYSLVKKMSNMLQSCSCHINIILILPLQKRNSDKPVYPDVTVLRNVRPVVSHSILFLKELKWTVEKSL